ncbi:MAG: sulfotransferase [Dinoroseobacter sp.]|nr:sulfotransferase [Dinoroseobacter sp.]
MTLLSKGKGSRDLGRKAEAFAPHFFVIGAMKAGTTTLSRYLDQRSDTGMPRIKETDFFLKDPNANLGMEWYKAQFDRTRDCLGEVSPNYTKYDIFPGVPERIRAVAPDASLIFIARDPVARFASHYRHSWLHGHMRVAPEDLLGSENGRHMIECSRYANQLNKYLACFDRSQLLIVDFDTLCETPQVVLNEITGFLGLHREQVTEVAAANTADQVARIPPFIKRAARSKLGRRIDRFIPNGTKQALGRAVSRRDPCYAPVLEKEVLQRAADLLREDAERFRTLAGRSFAQWSV